MVSAPAAAHHWIRLYAARLCKLQRGPEDFIKRVARHGYETDLLYLAGLVALCFGGPGPLSIDGLLNRFKKFGAAEA